MYRKVALIGATAVAVIGVGTAALAESGPSSGSTSGSATASTSTPAASGSTAPAAKAGKTKGAHIRLGRRGVQGTVVTRGKGNTFVTHDLIRGTVSAVSASSLAVKAADGTTETFAVTSATKVGTRTAGQKGRATASTISAVRTGDTVLVAGTGTTTRTAKHVVDVKK